MYIIGRVLSRLRNMSDPKYRRDLYKCRSEDDHIEKEGDEYVCGFEGCGKRFSSKSLNIARHHVLSSHMGGTRYQCTQCDNSYATPSALEKHMKGVHDNNRIMCDECNRSVADLAELERHKKRNHSGPSEPKYRRKGHYGTQPEDDRIEKLETGWYKCQQCPQRFSPKDLHHARKHVARHGPGEPRNVQEEEEVVPPPSEPSVWRGGPLSSSRNTNSRRSAGGGAAPGTSAHRFNWAAWLNRGGPDGPSPSGAGVPSGPVTGVPSPSGLGVSSGSVSGGIGVLSGPGGPGVSNPGGLGMSSGPVSGVSSEPGSSKPPKTFGFYFEDEHLAFKESEYHCLFDNCTRKFSLAVLSKAREHVKSTHLIHRAFQCIECDQSYDDAGGLERHMNTAHRAKQFACTQCDKKYADKGGLDRHVRRDHLGIEGPKYQRKGPFKTQPEDAYLEKPGEKYLCTYDGCTRQFSKKDLHKARNHVEFIHLGRGKFQCPVDGCDKEYVDKAGLDTHTKVVHQHREFQCSECDRKFGYQHTLDHHIKVDHKGEFLQCTKCPNTYRSVSGLHKHIFSAHTDQKAHCSQCPQEFADLGSLGRHFKIAHTSDKVYVQCQCGREFQTVRDLNKHVERKKESAPDQEHGRINLEDRLSVKAEAFSSETKVITAKGNAKYVWELAEGEAIQCGKGKIGHVKEVRGYEGKGYSVLQVTNHLLEPLHPVDLDRSDSELQLLFGKAGFEGVLEKPESVEEGQSWGAMLQVAPTMGRPTSGWFRQLCEDNGFSGDQVYDAAWILGLWIGDGTWARLEICCNALDTQEIERIVEAGKRLGLKPVLREKIVTDNPKREEPYVSAINVALTTEPARAPNPMWDVIMQSGARGITDGDWKVFPWQLIYDELDVVTWVMAGLIDSDGYVRETNGLVAKVKTIYPKLRDNILEAGRLLGWGWSAEVIPAVKRVFWGREVNCKECYTVTFTGDDLSKTLSKCNNAHKTRDLRHEKSSPRRKFFMILPLLCTIVAYVVVLEDETHVMLENGLVVPVVHSPEKGIRIIEEDQECERMLLGIYAQCDEEERTERNAQLRPLKRQGLERTERALNERREIEALRSENSNQFE